MGGGRTRKGVSPPSPLLCPEKEIELHRLLSENGGGYRERGGGRESGRVFFEEEEEAFAYPRRGGGEGGGSFHFLPLLCFLVLFAFSSR